MVRIGCNCVGHESYIVARILYPLPLGGRIGCELNRDSPIIIDRLSRCAWTFFMPGISRAAAIGFPRHPTQRGDYQ